MQWNMRTGIPRKIIVNGMSGITFETRAMEVLQKYDSWNRVK